ncbi:hypothetical protein [Halomonas salifodinae]|uniref:hypothetical protein n=1 Tax=Halomonas salifodinae TaxID=438745 RepID=UPI0033A9DCF5
MSTTESEPRPAPEGYAETAYRADTIPEQSYAPHNEMLRGRILEARLPWGSYLGLNPTTYQYSESWFREFQYIGDDYHDYTMINETRWSKRVDEDIGVLYRLLRFLFVIYSHGFSFIRAGGGGWSGGVFYRNCGFYLLSRNHRATFCRRASIPFFTSWCTTNCCCILWCRYSSSSALGKA